MPESDAQSVAVVSLANSYFFSAHACSETCHGLPSVYTLHLFHCIAKCVKGAHHDYARLHHRPIVAAGRFWVTVKTLVRSSAVVIADQSRFV